MLRVISLFSGVGGIDLGLERAGMRIVAQCEIDAYCRRVLARHWPDIPCFEDVREVSQGSVGERLRQVDRDGGQSDTERQRVPLGSEDTSADLLCGGFPCQGLSVAGKRRGLADERSGLFFEFARVADDLVRDGGWVLIENVPGLLSSNGGRDFAIVLATLAELGFHDLAWRVLDSRYFNVPQRRRRVFIVARRAAGSGARQVLLEPESGGGDFAQGAEAGTRVAASLASGSRGAGVSPPGRRQHDDANIVCGALDRQAGGADDNTAQANHLVSGAIVKRYGKGTDSDATDALLVAGPLGGGNDGAGRRSEIDSNLVLAGTVRSHMRPGSNDVGGLAYTLRRDPGGTGQGHNTTYVVGSQADANRDRATPRLSGRVDPDVIDPKPDGRRYEAMGNAVAVPVAQWVGERIVRFERAG